MSVELAASVPAVATLVTGQGVGPRATSEAHWATAAGWTAADCVTFSFL
jgi:hypothetical protein